MSNRYVCSLLWLLLGCVDSLIHCVVHQFFTVYFETYWMRNDAMIQLWNVYNVDRRTNNAVEGLNNWLNNRFGVHPAIWAFIEKLQKVHFDKEVERAQVMSGQAVNRRCSFAKTQRQQIKAVTNGFLDRTLSTLEFVTAISQTIHQGEMTPMTSVPAGFVHFEESEQTRNQAILDQQSDRTAELSMPIPSVIISGGGVSFSIGSTPSVGLSQGTEDQTQGSGRGRGGRGRGRGGRGRGGGGRGGRGGRAGRAVPSGAISTSGVAGTLGGVGAGHGSSGGGGITNAGGHDVEPVTFPMGGVVDGGGLGSGGQHLIASPTSVSLEQQQHVNDQHPLVDIAELTRRCREDIGQFVRDNVDRSREPIVWKADRDIPSTLTSNEFIARVVQLCDSLSPEDILRRPKYDNGGEGIDYGGLLSQLTSTICGNLRDYTRRVETVEDPSVTAHRGGPPRMVAGNVGYFSGGQSGFVPVGDSDVQEDVAFFRGLGKLLCLVVLHAGQWPKFHKTVLQFLLDPSLKIESTYEAVLELGPPFTSFYELQPHQSDLFERIAEYGDLLGVEQSVWIRFQSMGIVQGFDCLQACRDLILVTALRDRILPSLNAMRAGFNTVPLGNILSVEKMLAMYYTPIATKHQFFELVNIEDLRRQNEELFVYFKMAVNLMSTWLICWVGSQVFVLHQQFYLSSCFTQSIPVFLLATHALNSFIFGPPDISRLDLTLHPPKNGMWQERSACMKI